MTRDRIAINELSAKINQCLADYSDETQETVRNAVDKSSKDCVKQLKKTSPKRTGRYAKGWTRTAKLSGSKPMATVHNKNYRLPHLLEKGHAKVNGGRVEGRPHIAQAESKAAEEFEKLVVEGVRQ